MSRRDSLNFKSVISNSSFVIIAGFALMLILSWRRWTSLIADSGREMDLPWRLLNGELLYRDAHHIYPPLAPYFNALLYQIFGAHLDVLITSGVICSAIIVWLCWRMARRVLPETEALIATLAVVTLCVFKPSGNLISPYSYAALYSTAMSLGAVLMTLRYSEQQKLRELIAAGILIGLAAVTKQEFALAATITIAAAVLMIHRHEFRRLLLRLSIVALIALLIAAPVYAFFLWRVGWDTLINDCHLLYTNLPPSLVFYNRQRTGMDHPLSALVQITGGAAVGVAIASGIVLLSVISFLMISYLDRAPLKTSATDFGMLARKYFVALVIALAGAFLIRQAAQGRWDGSPLRALPLALVAMMFTSWRRSARNHLLPVVSADRALFILSVYSLAVLARVALRVPSGGAFGGFFLPTSLILIVYLITRAWPRVIEDRTQHQKLATRVRMAGKALLILSLAVTIMVFTVRYRRAFNVPINALRGTLYANQKSGLAIREALEFIEQRTAPNDPVAVLPEGSDLAFLTGRRMPLRHQILIPDFMNEQEERAAVARLQQENAQYVFITNRPMREFGHEAFGRDFYQTLSGWISEHYHLVKVCASGSLPENPEIGHPNFFIKIYARN
jgi:hypothetical protein